MAQFEELLQKLKSGEIKSRQLEDLTSESEAMYVRLAYISDLTNLDLSRIGNVDFEPANLRNKNIENLIGRVEIPVGVAGPIVINGDYADGEYLLPMATTEGTLVASTSRGCKVINISGGLNVSLTYSGITRAPLFRVKNIREIRKISTWVEENFELLKQKASETSSHIELLEIKSFSLGKNLWLRMSFDTDEAMGMNMATKAAKYISQFIVDNLSDIKLLAVSGNLCIDKKASIINMLLGRGRSIHADVTIKRTDVEKYLHTTPEEIVAVNQTKVWHGGVIAGGISFNAHFANIIAAMFAATGQDLAHIVNSSQGYSVMELEGEDLYVAVSLPSMLVGTVGGGTNLPHQQLMQDLTTIDINNPHKELSVSKAHILAEVIAGAVLAGDLSLHAALTAGELVSAHEHLGKGKLS